MNIHLEEQSCVKIIFRIFLNPKINIYAFIVIQIEIEEEEDKDEDEEEEEVVTSNIPIT